MSQRRVVITGLGVVSPIGMGWQEFWEGLCTQRQGVRRIEAFDASEFGCQIAGQVNKFKINQYIPRGYRKAAKLMAPDIAMAVAGADLAVRDAGLVTKGIDPENPQVDPVRLGANLGAGLIAVDLNELAVAVQESVDENNRFSYHLWGKRGMAQLTPLWLLKFLPNMLACHIGIIHDAQGPSNTILCGEISTHQAVSEAYHTVASGRVDICITGGGRSRVSPLGVLRLELLNRLNTTNNGKPEEAVRPFDKDRAGCVPGEGAGIFIMEDLQHAQGRGAKIYAELAGSASTRQSSSVHQIPPSAEGIARTIGQALDKSGCRAEDVELVIPHGVGGLKEDLAEAQGIRMGLGEVKAKSVPTLPIQGGVGNSTAGSGGLDLAAATLAISEGTIPAAVNCKHPCPECGLNIVQNNRNGVDPKVVLVVGYSIGGQSAALVIKRFAE
ncbi:MAG: beta-ketoacyl-[acyl-carrier-protein] synthase family protein [Phycisphaerae bacterium]|nr:beta-ketoacyl-[acyl-carrier-protein] synthase family protein [Phycisphaerae bacterium]